MDTDYQRHTAMALACEVLERIFAKFEQYTGRRYGFLHGWNTEEARTVFVVAGAAYGTFEEVARELKHKGIQVATLHPNVLRPFPKSQWAEALRGKRVFVFDRDDPFGAVGGRLYTELAGVANEYDLAATGTRLYSRIYGLGGRTPSLALARDEIIKALREQNGELELSREKSYVSVNI
jgi:pyruvate ferredoxin oxidoreductase alpha subunit